MHVFQGVSQRLHWCSRLRLAVIIQTWLAQFPISTLPGNEIRSFRWNPERVNENWITTSGLPYLESNTRSRPPPDPAGFPTPTAGHAPTPAHLPRDTCHMVDFYTPDCHLMGIKKWTGRLASFFSSNKWFNILFLYAVQFKRRLRWRSLFGMLSLAKTGYVTEKVGSAVRLVVLGKNENPIEKVYTIWKHITDTPKRNDFSMQIAKTVRKILVFGRIFRITSEILCESRNTVFRSSCWDVFGTSSFFGQPILVFSDFALNTSRGEKSLKFPQNLFTFQHKSTLKLQTKNSDFDFKNVKTFKSPEVATKNCWNYFEVWAAQRNANLVDLENYPCKIRLCSLS